LQLHSAKFMLDGVMESKTAFVNRPYAGTKDSFGLSHFGDDELIEQVDRVTSANLFSHFHGVGDAAVAQAVRAVVAVSKRRGQFQDNCRTAIAHVQVISESDLLAMAE
jgi:predicted amidohydrolase YtcJ